MVTKQARFEAITKWTQGGGILLIATVPFREVLIDHNNAAWHELAKPVADAIIDSDIVVVDDGQHTSHIIS